MKKIIALTLLIIAALLPVNAAVYIVGQNPFGGWNPASGMEMTTTDNVVYTATNVEMSGTVYFIFTTQLGDWESVNSHRYGPTDGNQEVAVGSTMHTQISSNDQAAYYLNASGSYNITFNMAELTFVVEKIGSDPEVTDVYVLGEVNGNSWAPNVGVKMETSDNQIYTANITTTSGIDGYSYFGFSRKLADNADDWDAIANYRFGAVSDGDFLVGQYYLNKPLSLTSDGYQAFRIEAGEYTLTVDITNMTLVIGGEALNFTNEDRCKCSVDDPENQQVIFIFDPAIWNYNGDIYDVYVRGSFTYWDNYDYCKMFYDPSGYYYLRLSYDKVKIPGSSGQPEFKFFVNGYYPDGDKSFVPEGYIFMNGDKNHIVVFNDDDLEQIKEDSRTAGHLRSLSEFDLTTEAGQQEISNFRLVPGTSRLYRCYHPFKASRPYYDTEFARLHYVQELSAQYGIMSDIVLSGDETGSLETYNVDGQNYTETIPEYYQSIINHNSVLYVGKSSHTPDYTTVYYWSDSEKVGNWMKEIAEFIIDDNNRAPFSIHCRLGTDRTGVYCASLAAICGATWQEIAADYKLSNRLGIREFRGYKLLQYSMQKMLGVANINDVENLQEAVINYYVNNGYLTTEQVTAIQNKLVDPPITPLKPGDVNGDGIVSSVDVTILYNWLLNSDDSDIVDGDQDGDGIITAVDITIIYNILLGNNN